MRALHCFVHSSGSCTRARAARMNNGALLKDIQQQMAVMRALVATQAINQQAEIAKLAKAQQESDAKSQLRPPAAAGKQGAGINKAKRTRNVAENSFVLC
jgi:predicted ATP-dependent Lon-type protease